MSSRRNSITQTPTKLELSQKLELKELVSEIKNTPKNTSGKLDIKVLNIDKIPNLPSHINDMNGESEDSQSDEEMIKVV